jgi:hypothetical protein
MNRPNSDFDIILFIECENPLNKMIEIYYRTQTHVPNSLKPNEVNDNNMHLSHMLYYGYKILYDDLGLKEKIEGIVSKNQKKVREIAKHDDKKVSLSCRTSFM